MLACGRTLYDESMPAAVRAFPVSVKGVTVQAGRVLLLENERAEWELPGGKLELGEDPPDCVAREISEETGWLVTAGPLLDCWQYHIGAGRGAAGPPRAGRRRPRYRLDRGNAARPLGGWCRIP